MYHEDNIAGCILMLQAILKVKGRILLLMTLHLTA